MAEHVAVFVEPRSAGRAVVVDLRLCESALPKKPTSGRSEYLSRSPETDARPGLRRPTSAECRADDGEHFGERLIGRNDTALAVDKDVEGV